MRLIDADALIEHFPEEQAVIKGHIRMGYAVGVGNVRDTINAAPTIDYPIEQIKWERDIAVEQLKAIGKGLGETMDDVQPVKTGKWLYNGSDGYNMFGEEFRWKKCSLCGYSYSTELSKSYNYCPNCGAKMENT